VESSLPSQRHAATSLTVTAGVSLKRLVDEGAEMNAADDHGRRTSSESPSPHGGEGR